METYQLIPLVAIVMGTLTVLVPVSLIALRFAIKPIAEAVAQMRAGVAPEEVRVMQERISLLEQQVNGIDSEVSRISEAVEFQDRLLKPGDKPA
ncbi:MAG: hypothetical protein M8872_10015 [marine benthic group bacterium]|nr:hypothetical protein [Gemmatimonadota bacterium]